MSGPANGGNGEWICRRCSFSNPATAPVCVSCALLRGADVPAAEILPAATARRTRSRQLSLTQWSFVAIIAIGVVAGTWFFSAHRNDGGNIEGAGDLSPFELQVGDCFNLIDVNAEQTQTVHGVPCAEPHVYEVFWVGDHPDGDYPTPEQVIAFIDDRCVPAFESFVGIPYNQSVWSYHFGGPTQTTWNDGERRFACYLHNQAGSEVTGSARNSRR